MDNSIKTVVLPEGVENIPDNLFENNPLETINIPESVKTIGYRAFAGTALTSVTIGKNITEIDAEAFASCTQLTEIIYNNTDKYLSYMGRHVFLSCTSLKTAFLPDGCKRVASGMFARCTGITEVAFPLSLDMIAEDAFNGSGLKRIFIPENVVIRKSAFMACGDLEKIILSEGMTAIQAESFASCPKLEKVVIPTTVTEISEDAFEASGNITIYCVENSFAETYAVTNNVKCTTLSVDPIKNQIYTGKAIEPKPTVFMGYKSLTLNNDYTVKYKDNINVGTATLLVRGTGDLSVLTSTCKFSILEADITKLSIFYDKSVEYNPNENAVPEVTVKYGALTLKDGADYELSVDSPVNGTLGVGKHVFFITGLGNFSGVINRNDEIATRQIDSVQYGYNGNVTLTDGDYKLVYGKDYSYTRTVDGDEVTMDIKGLGNYNGSFTKTETFTGRQRDSEKFDFMVCEVLQVLNQRF